MTQTRSLLGAWLTLLVTGLLVLSAGGLNAGEIHDAAAAGDLAKVRAMVEADPKSVQSKDDYGSTPLHAACRARQAAVAELLLATGADVNARNNYGFTPFHFACSGPGQSADLIRRLIASGAGANAQSDSGQSAIQMTGDAEVIKLLIERGADVNARDRYLGTVLHKTINAGTEEAATLLVRSGARLNQKFSYGNAELHLAALRGFAGLTRLMIERGADVDALNEYSRTALYYAAKHGYRSVADVLIAAGARPGAIEETNYGRAPQLAAPFKEGEAYVWYLGGLYGGGYAVKTKHHLLIFDKTDVDDSAEAGLANGHLNPGELSGQKITVFITKMLGAEGRPRPLELARCMPGVALVVDARPGAANVRIDDPPLCRVAVPNESFVVDGVQVHAIPAAGRGHGGAVGVGYLVEADGTRIFHAGFHASGHRASQSEEYRRGIDVLKPFGPIDIAILSVDGHLTAAYEPYLYLLDQLSPKAVYLMGGDYVTDQYPVCAEVLRARNVPVAYPEGGIAVGERFHFVRDQVLGPRLTGDATTATVKSTPAGNAPQITYVANEGFLLEHGGKKVLIDALFDAGAGPFLSPSQELLAQLTEARGPLADVDLLLVTHAHADHFNPKLVAAYLRNNTRCRLIAHTQTVDQLRKEEGFAQIQERIHEVQLEPGSREHVIVNGIAVDVLCLSHMPYDVDGRNVHERTRNLAFIVDLGGTRFLHLGDATVENSLAHLNAYPLRRDARRRSVRRLSRPVSGDARVHRARRSSRAGSSPCMYHRRSWRKN